MNVAQWNCCTPSVNRSENTRIFFPPIFMMDWQAMDAWINAFTRPFLQPFFSMLKIRFFFPTNAPGNRTQVKRCLSPSLLLLTFSFAFKLCFCHHCLRVCHVFQKSLCFYCCLHENQIYCTRIPINHFQFNGHFDNTSTNFKMISRTGCVSIVFFLSFVVSGNFRV